MLSDIQTKKITLKAKEFKLVFKAKKYKNNKTKYDWICEKGHTINSTWANIQAHNGFCNECDNKRKIEANLMQANQLALKKGGVCLSKTITNNRCNATKWKCRQGHAWNTSVESIKFADSWCPRCNSGDEINLKSMKILAKNRGGDCLKFIEIKNRGKLFKWECSVGHTFLGNTNTIKTRGSWCPECSRSLGERICREFFENYFNEDFPNLRPNGLKNKKTGANLELDGYSKKLGIAFEHQGQHHYSTKNHLFSQKHKEIKELDKIKIKICADNKVILIIVPEIPTYLKIKELSNFLEREFINKGVIRELRNFEFEPKKAYRTSENIRLYQKLEKQVHDKGGTLISKFYLGAQSHHEVQCSCGHIWHTRAGNIHSGRWCPECAAENRIINYKITMKNKRKLKN